MDVNLTEDYNILKVLSEEGLTNVDTLIEKIDLSELYPRVDELKEKGILVAKTLEVEGKGLRVHYRISVEYKEKVQAFVNSVQDLYDLE